ncbi:NACHT domain-containing protein [Streptomyces sp. NPDC050848]|uniref:NACHT domain-containing protein n=1 Tax=Streptomyces sp. NPDC050848 TaxID=3155791 RepID=UPI0033D65228
MQGLEVALARLAGTVLGAVVRSVVVPRKGAGLVDSPVRPLPRPAKPDRLAKVLGARLASGPYATLPEHERLAAVDGVRDTLAAAGPVDADRLFAVDLDPERLRGELRAPDAGLVGRTLELYDDLLGLCCAHLVEQLTAEPSFAGRAAVEHARVAGRTRDAVESLTEALPRPEAEALAFEERYATYVAQTQGRLELFGLTLGRSAREWPLDTAYISLAVSGDRPDVVLGLPQAGRATVSAEQALATADRLLLRGPAGSGKSTLVQWLALNAARRSFPQDLADWNRCVPFVLRLRAFTSADSLPMPEDFLPASGVPLRPPAGWTEALLASGRALVLVDGVDEVPVRLRQRTETWLKNLIAAFPAARYVVTTRPSAVPEEWLARHDFTAHSLLPMDRESIRSFIRHWHEAARSEDPSDELLDGYERSLRHAVTTRRDLSRLATNPLMCALLCALNRDRRTQLPRARKELYDAALDMLLVRRDTEREICGVEGVELTREEQTALLQRLAYWLIRNGQVQADRTEAEELVTEWLTAMPQVRGAAPQVFTHLLIRSGLLREPTPGTVDFVHRTFLDHLGAKAAVEARDLGVLVKHAHDDTWDDVVQMAVGHARVEERARLLKQLLRRADRAPKLRHRLVLLAAACLEQAPELDPAVRREVEDRTRELVPPRTFDDAERLAKVGELVLPLLPGPQELSDREAEAVVRTAAAVGGDAALGVISRFHADTRIGVRYELGMAWPSFEAAEYAETVLAHPAAANGMVHVRTDAQLRALAQLPHLREVTLVGDRGLPEEILRQTALTFLNLSNNDSVTDFSPLHRLPDLHILTINRCRSVADLRSLGGLPLDSLHVYRPAEGTPLAPLMDLPRLRHLTFDHQPAEQAVGDLPFGPALTGLGLFQGASTLRLDGIEEWPELSWLSVSGAEQWRQLTRTRLRSSLRTLQILDVDGLDLAEVVAHRELVELFIGRCPGVRGIAALRELPGLELLRISHSGSVDTAPLTEREGLRVEVRHGVTYT